MHEGFWDEEFGVCLVLVLKGFAQEIGENGWIGFGLWEWKLKCLK